MVHVDAAEDWGASGLAHLTGDPTGPADFSRAAVLGHARLTAESYQQATGVDVDAATLLAGRAGLLGLSRRGQVSAGGASRLFAARDGWCALTLSRSDDVDAVPALVESADVSADPWPAIEQWAAGRDAAEVAERARLLGLPAAALGEPPPVPVETRRLGARAAPRTPSGLLVVDMSSMWAGPLCGQLLARAGAVVVKVESRVRPDGTRSGPPAFFDWMNGEKLSLAVDFDQPSKLRRLLTVADVVVESSRPAALRRRGVGAEDVAPRLGRVWLRITGHGPGRDQEHRVAFGDDAAVAGGLVGVGARGPVFCADAIADPLTGLHTALLVAESLARGGGELLDVAMAGIAATYAELPTGRSDGGCPVLPPRPPPPARPAAELGEDDARVERLIDERGSAPC
jgi:hypothetical protein